MGVAVTGDSLGDRESHIRDNVRQFLMLLYSCYLYFLVPNSFMAITVEKKGESIAMTRLIKSAIKTTHNIDDI